MERLWIGSIPKDFSEYGHETGFRFADVTGDGIVDLVEALNDGVAPQYKYKGVYPNSGSLSSNTNYPDYLTNIATALGEEVEVKYLASPLYKDENDDLYNPHLPLVINTVQQIVRDDGFGNRATTTYSYRGGEYFFDNLLQRKFAGFASTTRTDATGGVTATYFHQGNDSLSSIGEYDDTFSKSEPYRIETYDSGGNLYARTINKWESVPQSNDRNYVKLAQTVTSAYDGDSDHRDHAATYQYDEYTGNLLQQIDYGEVFGNDDGSFADTGTDRRIATTTYAASTTLHILGLPAQETILNNASSTVKQTKHYYDSLPFGNVSKGNETGTEFWKSGSEYASTTKAYDAYGLVTQVMDGLPIRPITPTTGSISS